MELDAKISLWQALMAAGTAVVWLAGLHWKLYAVSRERDRDLLDRDRERVLILGEIKSVRDDVSELEKRTERQDLRQTEFQLAVTNRLTAIETLMGQAFNEVKGLLRDALKH